MKRCGMDIPKKGHKADNEQGLQTLFIYLKYSIGGLFYYLDWIAYLQF